ncbi:MAG: hypothetical protein Q9174_006433, partial [Haloplaca sp. 1 TL-2023]
MAELEVAQPSQRYSQAGTALAPAGLHPVGFTIDNVIVSSESLAVSLFDSSPVSPPSFVSRQRTLQFLSLLSLQSPLHRILSTVYFSLYQRYHIWIVSVELYFMSGTEMSLLDEQEMARQFEEAMNNGELSSLIDMETDFNQPEEATGLDTMDDPLGGVMDNSIFDQPTDFGFLEGFGGPVQVNDFTTNAPIDFTQQAEYQVSPYPPLEELSAPIDITQQAGYQVSPYPPLEELSAPGLPYFQAPAADYNYGVQPFDDGYGAFPQDQDLTLNYNEFDPSFGMLMGPPPVPVHSKPNIQTPEVQNPSNECQAPVARMTRQRLASQSSHASSGSEWTPTPASKPTQRGRKRKVASVDSSDEEPLDSTEKRRRTDDAIEKATYRLGMYTDVKPDEAHTRTATIHQFDPTTVYDAVTRTPQQWGIFKYNPYGELETGRFYTSAEIATYLYHHPLHTLPDGTYAPKHGGLCLYIQRNPADSARRYPSTRSNRCRFADCFATHNLINQGHLRVCFTENHPHNSKKAIDPFNCAGYVHLNCLERLLDFPNICANLAIGPEDRILPSPDRNRAIMDPPSCNGIAKQFVKDCESGVLEEYPKGARPHKGSLTW